MTNPSFIHLFIHGISEATTVYQALFFCWYGFTVSLSLFFWNGIYLPFINTSLLDTFVSHYTCPIRIAEDWFFFLFLPAIILFFFKDIFAFIWLCIWIISYICKINPYSYMYQHFCCKIFPNSQTEAGVNIYLEIPNSINSHLSPFTW